MTVEQLNKANELQKEIDQLYKVFSMLDFTIENEESQDNPVKKFIRFLNCALNREEERKAHIILFEDGKICGQDIPVDLDLLKCLRSYFKGRLDDKIRERNEL